MISAPLPFGGRLHHSGANHVQIPPIPDSAKDAPRFRCAVACKRSFEKVGANILNPSEPNSMTEFLGTVDAEQEIQASDAPMHKELPREERLHVFIKGEGLYERGVVEDALGKFLIR